MKKKAVIIFIPAIHKGYIDFLAKNKGDIFILGKSIIDSYVHLTRDLRVPDPKKTMAMLQEIFPKRNFFVLDAKGIKKLNKENYEIIMPDDEVTRDLAGKYFKERNVSLLPAFLRWNKVITLKEYEIPAHRKITEEQFHKEMIALAGKEAAKSGDWWRQIGCVIVKDGKILAQGHNHYLPSDHHMFTFGDPRSNFDAGQHQEIFSTIHGEASAIAQAAHDGVSLDGATAYATTFPCPNCARLLSKAGIKKVYYEKGYSLFDAEKIFDHFGIEIILVQQGLNQAAQ